MGEAKHQGLGAIGTVGVLGESEAKGGRKQGQWKGGREQGDRGEVSRGGC